MILYGPLCLSCKPHKFPHMSTHITSLSCCKSSEPAIIYLPFHPQFILPPFMAEDSTNTTNMAKTEQKQLFARHCLSSANKLKALKLPKITES